MKRLIIALVFVIFLISSSSASGKGYLILQTKNPSQLEVQGTSTPETRDLNFSIVKVEGNGEEIIFSTKTSENLKVDVESGYYKVYVYLNENIVLEYNNDSIGYEVDGGETLIPLYDNTFGLDILADAPWKIGHGLDVPITYVVKDANQWAVFIRSIKIMDYDDGDALIKIIDLDQEFDQDYWYYNDFLDRFGEDQKTLHVQFDIAWDFDVHNYLHIKLEDESLPKISDWYCGDTHFHTIYTDTEFEFGMPINSSKNAAQALGLDWFIATDHSNSLDSSKWDQFVDDCSNFDFCLQGEEVNCDYGLTGWGNHYLSYDIMNLILGPTINSYSCAEVIFRTQSQGGFGYAAHPESDLALGFIIDEWHDYSLNFTGLEVWNGDISEDLDQGLEKWKDILLGRNGLEARKVFVSAGSDAHGDFNTKFGKEYTCCYAPTYSKSNIFYALENGRCYMSNNGALIFDINGEKIGGTKNITEGDQVTLNIDYNIINSCKLKVFKGEIGGSENQLGSSVPLSAGSSGNIVRTDSPTQNSYYRLECISNDGDERIYTNPIWVNVNECVPDWSCSDWEPEECPKSEIQTRTCTDLNECGTNEGKPNETQSCEYLELCTIHSPLNSSIYNKRSIIFNISAKEKLDSIEYIDYSETRPRWKSLCSRCEEYGFERKKTKSFIDGEHELAIKCVPYYGDEEFHELQFFSDSKDPSISKTEPKRNEFTNGSFMVKYTEENVKDVDLLWNLTATKTDCPSGKNQECYFDENLTNYDGQEIEYYFAIEDIAGNIDESRKTKVKVDTTPPVVNNFYYEIDDRKVEFFFDITELNFEEVNYVDGEDSTPREKVLCSRVKNGICETKKSFSREYHNLTITVLDKAGNSWQKNINFIIENQ